MVSRMSVRKLRVGSGGRCSNLRAAMIALMAFAVGGGEVLAMAAAGAAPRTVRPLSGRR